MLNIPNFQSEWTNHVHKILIETGRPDIWINQDNLEQQQLSKLKQYTKQTLIQQYRHNCHTLLLNSSKGRNYSLFKENILLENYLLKLSRNECINLIKFRTATHHLPIETGRWEGIEIEDRKCQLCNKNDIGDEFHYLLASPKLLLHRPKYYQVQTTIIYITFTADQTEQICEIDYEHFKAK